MGRMIRSSAQSAQQQTGAAAPSGADGTAAGDSYREAFPAPPLGATAGAHEDGAISSVEYARSSEVLSRAAGALDVAYHHRLEKIVGRAWCRRILRYLTTAGPRGTPLERMLASYANPAAPWGDRVKFWLGHRVIDHLRGSTPRATVRTRLVEHAPTVRGLVLTTRSIAEFGLMLPQRFSSPLFCVWNFTNRCNLRCRHCYQDAAKAASQNELTPVEKLDVVDQLGAMYVPMLALAGGEPTMSPDLLPVLRRAQQYGMHTTVATNGTTMTERLAADLAAAGVRYVEISLDSVDPARHDAFRGQEGMWQRSVAGMRTVVATPGLRLGVAMCVHQGNVHEVQAMLDFAIGLGAGCFAHFNFIPVGRGLKMVEGDLTPQQHEDLLSLLNEYMQRGQIGVISTAPQFGRVALAQSDDRSGRTACSHAGSGSGTKARVVAKYLGGCGAGRTYICMEPAGDVTPCVYLPHRVMGNVRLKPIQQIFRESIYHQLLCDRDQRLHHCRTCAFKLYCGGCRARADAYFGQLHGGDPGCIFNSRHWDALVAQGTVAAAAESPAMETMKLSPTRHGPA